MGTKHSVSGGKHKISGSPLKALQSSVSNLSATSGSVDMTSLLSLLDARYLRKIIEETSYNNIYFRTATVNATSFQTIGASAGNVTGVGALITTNADGTAKMEIDELAVRKIMYVNELLIAQVTHTGGVNATSAANAIVADFSYITTDDDTCPTDILDLINYSLEDDEQQDGVWRCRFDNENNNLTNLFAVGDVAMSQTFNYDPSGSYEMKYYRRRVLGIGQNYIDLEVGGIALSNVDNSSISEGDNCVQWGHLWDRLRQSVVEINTLEGGRQTFLRNMGDCRDVLSEDRKEVDYDDMTDAEKRAIWGSSLWYNDTNKNNIDIGYLYTNVFGDAEYRNAIIIKGDFAAITEDGSQGFKVNNKTNEVEIACNKFTVQTEFSTYDENWFVGTDTQITEIDTTATQAATDAATAQTTADTVTLAVDAINDDGVFSINEKLTTRTEWELISGLANVDHTPSEAGSTGSYAIAVANAKALGGTTETTTISTIDSITKSDTGSSDDLFWAQDGNTYTSPTGLREVDGYSYMRLHFTANLETEVSMSCSISSEAPFDMLVIGAVDTELTYDDWSHVIGDSFYGTLSNGISYASGSSATYTRTIPIGEHYIDVWYDKDGGSTDGLDRAIVTLSYTETAEIETTEYNVSTMELTAAYQDLLDIFAPDELALYVDENTDFTRSDLSGALSAYYVAESAVKSATTAAVAIGSVAGNLGYASYDDMVAKAQAGNTLISGGFLNNTLINTQTLVAQKVLTNAASGVVGMEITEKEDVGDGYFNWSVSDAENGKLYETGEVDPAERVKMRLYINAAASATLTLNYSVYSGADESYLYIGEVNEPLTESGYLAADYAYRFGGATVDYDAATVEGSVVIEIPSNYVASTDTYTTSYIDVWFCTPNGYSGSYNSASIETVYQGLSSNNFANAISLEGSSLAAFNADGDLAVKVSGETVASVSEALGFDSVATIDVDKFSAGKTISLTTTGGTALSNSEEYSIGEFTVPTFGTHAVTIPSVVLSHTITVNGSVGSISVWQGYSKVALYLKNKSSEISVMIGSELYTSVGGLFASGVAYPYSVTNPEQIYVSGGEYEIYVKFEASLTTDLSSFANGATITQSISTVDASSMSASTISEGVNITANAVTLKAATDQYLAAVIVSGELKLEAKSGDSELEMVETSYTTPATSSSGTTRWYRRFNSGFTIAGGTYASGLGSTAQTVTYGVTFTDAPTFLSSTNQGLDLDSTWWAAMANSVGTTSTTVYRRRGNPSNTAGDTAAFSWVAFGFTE